MKLLEQQKIVKEVIEGNIKINDINANILENFLDTKNQNDPDLIIRTAGNQRISNFLLWQIAYTELYFSETNWPDFTSEELKKIIFDCKDRVRTFGSTNKSIKLYNN